MSSNIAKCKLDHNKFCFICGQYIFVDKKRPLKFYCRRIDTHGFSEVYQHAYHCDIGDRNIEWSPDVCCVPCYRRLFDKSRPIKFNSPTKWNVPKNHPLDCYFCNTIVNDCLRVRKCDKVEYPKASCVEVAVPIEGTLHGSDDSATSFEGSVPSKKPRTNNTFDDDLLSINLMDTDEARTEHFNLPGAQSEIAATQAQSVVATALINALQPIASSPMPGLTTIVSALIQALVPMTTSSATESTSIALALMKALEPIATPYSLRQAPVPTTYDAQTSTAQSMATTPTKSSSHEEWITPVVQPPKRKSPILTQPVLNDLVRDLSLPKHLAELFASRIVQLLQEHCPNIADGTSNGIAYL